MHLREEMDQLKGSDRVGLWPSAPASRAHQKDHRTRRLSEPPPTTPPLDTRSEIIRFKRPL